MSSYVGDFRTGKVVRKMWNSNAVAGESITRATNGTISVYKDGGTTQSTAGVTDTEDFDGLTGVHLVAVDTSADGTFYSAGSDFEVVLSGATIDGKSINATLFSFSLENRSALMPTTDGRKLTVESDGMAHADLKEWLGTAPLALSAQQVQAVVPNTQKVDVETIKTQAVTCAAPVTVGAFVGQGTAAIGVNASGHVSRVTLVDTITTYTGDTPQTGDSFARIGANGSSLSAIPWNAAWDAEVESEVTDALNAYDPPTHAELLARTLPSADYATAANLAIVAGFIDTEITTIITHLTEIKGATFSTATDSLEAIRDRGDAAWAMDPDTVTMADRWLGMVELDGAVYRYTTNALEQAPGGGASDPWATNLPAAYVAGQAGYILGTFLNASITGIPAAVWSHSTRTLTAPIPTPSLPILTPNSALSSYATADEMLIYHDIRTIADLISDVGARVGGTVPNANTVKVDAKLLAALNYAAGLIEAAATRAKRYQPADLANLTGVSKQLLVGMNCDLAMMRLIMRRPDLKLTMPATVQMTMQMLESLANGDRIFSFLENQAAGLPSHHVDTRQDIVDRAFTTKQAHRYFGTNAEERGPRDATADQE